MTLKELKSLFEEKNQLHIKKLKIYKNDDLSRNQKKAEAEKISPRLNEIKLILNKYKSVFTVKAHFLGKNIKEVLSHSISESLISVHHDCTGKYYDKEYFEGTEKVYEGKASLKVYISSLGNIETISLFERYTGSDLTYNTDYIYGVYDVNCLELLYTNRLSYAQCFHKACWLAIEENLKMRNRKFQAEVNSTQKLINKKITQLQKQSKFLEKQKEKITKNSTIVLTDEKILEIEELKEI